MPQPLLPFPALVHWFTGCGVVGRGGRGGAWWGVVGRGVAWCGVVGGVGRCVLRRVMPCACSTVPTPFSPEGWRLLEAAGGCWRLRQW